MFTLLEIKHDPLFRCYFRFPAYLKNLVLLVAQAVLLTMIYFVYLRGDGNLHSAIKIFNGMTSHTFNYMTQNMHALEVN